MDAAVRPRIVVSRCIEFDSCRYNGAMISSEVVQNLKDYADFVPVCPEVDIGLGVPREPIRIIRPSDEDRLWQPSTGRDYTRAMAEFCREFLDGLEEVDGFILKSRSPSCGIKDVKIYGGAGDAPPAGKGAGFFGRAVLERFGGLAVEDEGRLRDFGIREHFLTRTFTLARFRDMKQVPSMGGLVAFQTQNKFLLMAYHQKTLREMGRVVANKERKSQVEVLSEYESLLYKALAKPPRRNSAINVLMHAMGYFSKELSHREKQFFLDSLERYRARRIPLSVPVGIVKSWIVRFDQDYLRRQAFFEPYPEALLEVTDSGKGRDK
jgi:uncharacterized protein YbgA (DUF1722 family)/uncharacterized protein YbbK (DUF523 family)